jgi:hypothetical protein
MSSGIERNDDRLIVLGDVQHPALRHLMGTAKQYTLGARRSNRLAQPLTQTNGLRTYGLIWARVGLVGWL